MRLCVCFAVLAFLATSMAMTVERMKIIPENNVTCPDEQTQCPDGQTCCKDTLGGYSCCSLPHAVCCSDKLSCCPQGTTCDLQAGMCRRGNDLLEWFVKTPGKPVPAVNDVTCPDEQTQCPDGQTCCKDTQGGYGCCPLPNAVCCSDKLHCCPQGTTCDLQAGMCRRGNDLLEWFEKKPGKPVPSSINGRCKEYHQCHIGAICCDKPGGYFCCHPETPQCCGEKCCPLRSHCEYGECYNSSSLELLLQLWKPEVQTAEENPVCPDHKTQCPAGQTCCKDTQGGYGCCPLPNAVCCSDKLHCCPQGTTCDLQAGMCRRGNDLLEWFVKTPGKPVPAVNAVTCPDEQTQCPDGQTCCKDTQGGYGCCPLPNAVCCSDKLHCCPQGTTCDLQAGMCRRGNDLLEWFVKTPGKPVPAVNDVTCPDEQTQCPDGQTCCKDTQGGYGCCPLPNAVCCSDKLHCCPQGTTCDLQAGMCRRGNNLLEWFEKKPGKPVPSSINGRCKEYHQCPIGYICCDKPPGGFFCCRPETPRCCRNKCCPPRSHSLELLLQLWKPEVQTAEENPVCPDEQTQCPAGQTCCKDTQGGYGCCPLPNAVCCSDKLHCCPQGTTCDLQAGMCRRGNDLLEWFVKRPGKPVPAVNAVTCPDEQTQCPDGQTCCKDTQGGYGCCPLPNAVCCSDKLHCCPQGTTCDLQAGMCRRGNDLLEWFVKTPGKPVPAVNDVTCPDEQTQCPDGQTCCKDTQGGYGCCPLPNAVCCSDKLHCCPQGTTCDLQAGMCRRGNNLLEWFEKKPGKPVPSSINGRCKEYHECPIGFICCDKPPGGFFCCRPETPQCCGNKCCPPRSHSLELLLQLWKPEVQTAEENPVCPDHKTQCPAGQTCCQNTEGGYGCCPLPNAVCCSDKLHCCPNGYTCNVSAGMCEKSQNGEDKVQWFEKRPGTPVVRDV